MNKPLSLRKNFIWAFTGNAVYYACQWAMLMFLAKLNDPGMVGTFALAVAIVTPVMLFSNLQIQSVFVTDTRHEYSFRQYLRFRMFTTITAMIVISFVALFFKNDFNTACIILIVGIGQGVLGIREMYLAALQKKERMDMVSHSNMLQGLLSLVLFGTTIWATRNLILGVLAILVARISTLFLFDIPQAGKNEEHLFKDDIKTNHESNEYIKLARLLWLSFPLGATVAIISLNFNVPRYFLEHFHDKGTLGYFAAIASLLAAGQMVVAAMGQSAAPRLANYYVDNRRAFSILVVKLASAGIFLGVCGLLITFIWGRHILTLFFNPDYASYHKELNWIMVAGAINYCSAFIGYSITAARYFKSQIILSIGTLATTAVSGWLFIPNYGIMGSAWSMVLSSIIGLIISITIIIWAIYNTGQIKTQPETIR